jgi:hypothetical protein
MKMPPWLEGAVVIEILNKAQVSINRVVQSPQPSSENTFGQEVKSKSTLVALG